MADQPRDIIVLGFRTSFYTKITRGPRKADGTPGDIIKTEENVPDHWVKYCNRNTPQSAATEDRIRHLDPDSLNFPTGVDNSDKVAFFQHRWAQIKPAFDAWVNGQKLPEYGIPLAAWPALDAGQVKAFQAAGINSIEDVRDIHESMMAKVRLPNLRDLKRLAGIYIDGLGATKAAEAQQALETKVSSLEEQLAAAMALLEEQAKATAESQGGKKKAA